MAQKIYFAVSCGTLAFRPHSIYYELGVRESHSRIFLRGRKPPPSARYRAACVTARASL